MLLDSDCVFSKSIDYEFTALANDTTLAKTYVVNHEREYKLHGLSGDNMRQLFADFGLKLENNPYYSGGELLFAKGAFFKHIANDFVDMYDNLIKRHTKGDLKFNEEAQVLSYYYYKLDCQIGGMNRSIKRMWTNRNYYRNITPKDLQLTIWHLPSEKRVGIHNMFRLILRDKINIKELDQEKYLELLTNELTKVTNHKLNRFKKFKSNFYHMLTKLKMMHK